MAGKSCPVLVYQMGKVASTSLCKALDAAGIEAVQTHFLGEQALMAILKRLLSPGLDPHFAHHMQGQLNTNILLTRQLMRSRAAIAAGGGQPAKVKVISLAREPLDWYRAELVQNYDGYTGALERFCKQAQGIERDPIRCLAETHRALLETLAGIDLTAVMRPPFPLRDYLQPALAANGQAALFANAKNFFGPLLWFQRLFEPPTGIDIFHMPAEQAGPGALRLESQFCEALVLQYERLTEALPALARFIGVASLRLPRSNVSNAKPQYRVVSAALADLEIPAVLVDAIYDSPYCKLFGYPRRYRF